MHLYFDGRLHLYVSTLSYFQCKDNKHEWSAVLSARMGCIRDKTTETERLWGENEDDDDDDDDDEEEEEQEEKEDKCMYVNFDVRYISNAFHCNFQFWSVVSCSKHHGFEDNFSSILLFPFFSLFIFCSLSLIPSISLSLSSSLSLILSISLSLSLAPCLSFFLSLSLSLSILSFQYIFPHTLQIQISLHCTLFVH